MDQTKLPDETPLPAAEKTWPHAPPVDGTIYGVVEQGFGEAVQMVTMTFKTWQHVLAQAQITRARLVQLSAENDQMRRGVHPDLPRIIVPGR